MPVNWINWRKNSRFDGSDMTFPVAEGVEGARKALDRLRVGTLPAAETRPGLILLSDRGVDQDRAALPALLALAVVWKSLVEAGAWDVSVVVESGQVIDTHHVALLVAAGASGVCPTWRSSRQLRFGPMVSPAIALRWKRVSAR